MVTVCHAHLDYMLQMTIKTVAGLTAVEAQAATADQTSSEMRKRLRQLAKQRLGEGVPLCKLDALLSRARDATYERNRLVHGLCIADKEGKLHLKGKGAKAETYPDALKFIGLVEEITQIVSDLDHCRRKGFLKEALEKKKA